MTPHRHTIDNHNARAATRRVVITHPEFGTYIGGFLGMGFWTNLDCAGQTECVTFDSEADAIDYIKTWSENNDPAPYSFVTVDAGQWANIVALKAAGIDTGPLELEALTSCEQPGWYS